MMETFVKIDNGHSYGSWKDVKNWCNYVYNKTHNMDHELINYSIKSNWVGYKKSLHLQLASKFPKV